jgi:hypothetical protein
MTTAQITIKADDENNAEAFWAEFSEAYPEIADQVRTGEATIDATTWEAIQGLEGFSGGPSYAPTALVEA